MWVVNAFYADRYAHPHTPIPLLHCVVTPPLCVLFASGHDQLHH